jgi:hypothetical protein
MRFTLVFFLFIIHSRVIGSNPHDADLVLLNAENGTPQLILTPVTESKPSCNLQDHRKKSPDQKSIIREYIDRHRDLFRLNELSTLKLIRTQKSLLGTHFTYAQTIGDIPVAEATLSISVAPNGDIYKVFNALVPDAKPVLKNTMTRDQALQLAWNHLKIHGSILSNPVVEELVLKTKTGSLIPGFRVQIIASKPAGSWQVDLDGRTGTILNVRQLATKTRHDANENFNNYKGPVLSLKEAGQNLNLSKTTASENPRINGSALVFEPEPRTALLKDDLKDTSPAEAFTSAYVTRPLNEITNDNGTYRLTGPYCQIVDGDSPHTAPSTSTTGQWTSPRRELAFYDTMCYYHVDRSQRHVQALGFTGDRGIMDRSLETDSNGQSGADNSSFNFTYNSSTGKIENTLLSFGQGGVPDDGDSDVIVHEYGHALNFSIVGNYSGGDTGAIAEGFSDYWASSHRIELTHGLAYHPSWIFHWDGHSSSTWRGRYLNAYSAQYDPSRQYRAHYPIANGWITDELWSTPVFQTLLNCLAQGYPRDEVDQIMLESFFGMGPGTTMREQAEAIVQTATQLYPHKPYAEIFTENFQRNRILEEESGFIYYASHIPPAGNTAIAWKSEIALSNTGDENAAITVLTYEKDTVSGSFSLAHTETLDLATGTSQIFVPKGENQRWVCFQSSRALTGTLTFFRTVDDSKTEERVSIPLAEGRQLEQTILFPHVPAHRTRFWSGGVLLNPTSQIQNLTFTLIGTNGSNLSHLLSSSTPQTLQPYEKWVSFFANSLFNDDNSTEKVDYIQVHCDTELIAFELFGYQPDEPYSATSGIASTSFFNRSLMGTRHSLNCVDWSGFVIVNPYDHKLRTHVKIISEQGAELQAIDYTLEPRQKVMGLNDLDSGFTFPFGSGDPVQIQLTAGTKVGFTVLESEAPLKLFELAGDHENSVLDGYASWGACDEAVFTQVKGSLEILNGPASGRISFLARNSAGEIVLDTSNILDPWESTTLDFSTLDAASLVVSGSQFFAFLVERDTDKGSLAIRSGTLSP